MPLFDFSLKPIAAVAPWGPPDDPKDRSLSWFGLTDGTYAINLNGARLFQYTPEMLAYLNSKYPENEQIGDCADYQVVRLYEDILDLLPDAMISIPARAQEMVGHVQARRSWMNGLSWVLEIDDDPPLDELYWRATDWFGYRRLDSMYLIQGPSTWFWRFGDRVYIQWDNAGKETAGIPRWTATAGDCSMPVETFWGELESFHTRLMSAMSERVANIKTQNPLPNVRIDVEQLTREHEERKLSLAQAKLASPHEIDWDLVFAANDELKNHPRHNNASSR